jgi:hypothetical protein
MEYVESSAIEAEQDWPLIRFNRQRAMSLRPKR